MRHQGSVACKATRLFEMAAQYALRSMALVPRYRVESMSKVRLSRAMRALSARTEGVREAV